MGLFQMHRVFSKTLFLSILWLASSGCYLIKGGFVAEEQDDDNPSLTTMDMAQIEDMSPDLGPLEDMEVEPAEMNSPDEGPTCSPASPAALCAQFRQENPEVCGVGTVLDPCTMEERGVDCGCLAQDTECREGLCVDCETRPTREVCGDRGSCEVAVAEMNACGKEVTYNCADMCAQGEECQLGSCVEVEIDLCEDRGAECGTILDNTSMFAKHCGSCPETQSCSGNRCVSAPNKCPSNFGCGSATQSCACDLQQACVLGSCKNLEVLPADVRADMSFGEALALFDDLMIVGASRADEGQVEGAGAAYVYRRDQRAGHWSQMQKLVSSDPQANASFGSSVATNGRFIAVGARNYDGQGNAQVEENSGRVEIFALQPDDSWNLTQVLEAPVLSAQQGFGRPLLFDGGLLYVGAPAVNGGSVLIYEFTENNSWELLDEIHAPQDAGEERFGYAVDVLGEWLFIGAPARSQSPTKAGQAFVFRRSRTGNGYGFVGALTAFDDSMAMAPAPEIGDEFGGDVLIAGTPIAPLFVSTASGTFNMREANRTYVFNTETNGVVKPMQRLTAQRYTDLAGRDGMLFAAAGDANNAAGVVDVYRFGGQNVGFELDSPDTFTPPVKNGETLQEGQRFGNAIAFWGFNLAVSAVYRTTSSPNSGAVYFMDTLP